VSAGEGGRGKVNEQRKERRNKLYRTVQYIPVGRILVDNPIGVTVFRIHALKERRRRRRLKHWLQVAPK